jgi:hypothetical protein
VAETGICLNLITDTLNDFTLLWLYYSLAVYYRQLLNISQGFLMFFAQLLCDKHFNGRHDSQHTRIQHNDIQNNGIQHNDIQHNDIQHKTLNITTLSITIYKMRYSALKHLA